MLHFLNVVKEFLFDLLLPSFCLNCQREGDFLCQDCFALIDLSTVQGCPFCSLSKMAFGGKTCLSCKKKGKKISALFWAAPYDNFIIKKLISQFKYHPFLKHLSKTLSSIIIAHFQLLEKSPDFSHFKIIAIPLHKKKLKERGFNQAQEIAQHLSDFLKIPLLTNVLIKVKETFDQTELTKEQRKENVKDAFFCQKPELVKGEKILLVDDVFTTGATLEEAARVLKKAGAKEIWGVTVARG